MIFFCFSSKDRHNVVEAILYHLTNFEIPVWYDRHKMLLGDDRNFKNFEDGVNKADYYLIILSPNAISSVCANEEIDLIKNQCLEGGGTVFPLFYNIKADEIPEKFSWLKKYVYKEINGKIDVYSACNHIICRLLLDELSKYKYQTIEDIYNRCLSIPIQKYVVSLLFSYKQIDDSNYNAKIAILYALFIYIKSSYDLTCVPKFYYSGIEKLFNEAKLNLETELREILICERSCILLLNAVLFGYIG